MRSQSVRLNPLGGMDSDSEILKVNNGKYISAENIRQLTDEGQSTFSVQNIKGNKLIFSFPEVLPSQKGYRVNIDISKMDPARTETWRVELYDNYANLIDFQTFVVNQASIATSATNLQTAVQAALATAAWTFSDGITPISSTERSYSVSVSPGYQYAEYQIYIIPPTSNDEQAILEINVYQEAVDLGIAGFLRPMSGYELGEDIFLWSTTQDNLPTPIPSVVITGATNANPIVITTNVAHTISFAQEIIVEGVLGNTAANGTFIAIPTSTTQLQLVQSRGAASGAFVASPNSVITLHPKGLGEIGVLTYNINTEVYDYTALLTSKQLNFIAPKQIKIHGEDNYVYKSFYFTDGFNPMRVFYYKGAYVNNGAIKLLNDEGYYQYETLSKETLLILSTASSRLTLNRVIQQGGKVKTGNIIYFHRFLTDALSTTDWIAPCNPINIYEAVYTDPNNADQARTLFGSEADKETSKIVELNIENIIPIFKYVEVAYVIYGGKGVSNAASILPRIALNEDANIIVQHTGNEAVSETEIDIGTLNKITAGYITAGYIDSLDNRLIIADLTTAANYDFTEFFATFQHDLSYDKILSVDTLNNNGLNNEQFKIAEYQLEQNVNSKVGYMLYETYRFFGVVEFNNGSMSQGFFIDDIRFDCDTRARRGLALPNYNLSELVGSDVYLRIPRVEFYGFNIDTKVGGTRIRDIIKRIHIYRAEVDNPTVLASGYVIPCVTGELSVLFNFPGYSTTFYMHGGDGVSDTNITPIMEYPFAAGNTWGNYATLSMSNPTYPGPALETAIFSTFTAKRRYVAFYSMDLRLGVTSITPRANDKILNFGQDYPDILALPSNYNFSCGKYRWTSGRTAANPFVQENILEGASMAKNTIVKMNGGADIITKNIKKKNSASYSEYDSWRDSGLMLRLSADISQPNTAMSNDYGFYNALYYRAAVNQYGSPENNKIIPTNSFIDLSIYRTNIVQKGSLYVYGGDTFTQVCYKKTAFQTFPLNFFGQPDQQGLQLNHGVRYVAQNKGNFSMRYNYGDGSILNYPNTTFSLSATLQVTGIKAWLWANKEDEPLGYNTGYNIKGIYNLYSKPVYDVNKNYTNEEPTTIAYSPKKVLGSQTDTYRQFLPIDIKILDYAYGRISGIKTANGELYSWQPRMFKKHYFNSDGAFTTQDGAEVIIGSGGVMARQELDLSIFGTYNYFGIVKGVSDGGKSILYWFNAKHNKFIRHGADGTQVISDRAFMSSFFRNNAKWVILYDQPLYNGGIIGVWNQKFSEAIFTFLAQRQVAKYNPATTYSIGQAVSYTPTTFSTFQQTGEIFISKTNGNIGNTPSNASVSNANWEIVPHTNPEYYSEFTIVWNEKVNSFNTYHTYKSIMMVPYKDTFISASRNLSNRTELYKHDEGDYGEWYNNDEVSIFVDSYIELVVNIYPDDIKKFQAIEITSLLRPYGVTFRTDGQQSFLQEADWELMDDKQTWRSEIKNDSTVTLQNPTGRNDIDTSGLFGKWLTVRIAFEKGVKQVVKDTIVKFQVLNRTNKQ